MGNLVLGPRVVGMAQARQPSASDKQKQVNAQRWWWVLSPSPPPSAKGSAASLRSTCLGPRSKDTPRKQASTPGPRPHPFHPARHPALLRLDFSRVTGVELRQLPLHSPPILSLDTARPSGVSQCFAVPQSI